MVMVQVVLVLWGLQLLDIIGVNLVWVVMVDGWVLFCWLVKMIVLGDFYLVGNGILVDGYLVDGLYCSFKNYGLVFMCWLNWEFGDDIMFQIDVWVWSGV